MSVYWKLNDTTLYLRGDEQSDYSLYPATGGTITSSNSSITSIVVENAISHTGSCRNMFNGCNKITSLDLSNFDTTEVTDMYEMFLNCKELLTLNLSNFNTNNVTTMYNMFNECRKIASLDLSSFNTSNVTNMSGMFEECQNLTSLNVSNFNTNNVTTMRNMFYDCYKITSLDLSNFTTPNLRSMLQMFCFCKELVSLNMSNFNTINVTNMSKMFLGCKKIASLDLSNFNTSNVTNMDSMFAWCYALTSLNISSFNTSNVTNMQSMFQLCQKLSNLNLSSFNTSNVTNMSEMFDICESLESLDVTNFNTSNVTDMYEMFGSCESLKSLDVTNFNTSNVTNMSGMFAYCYNLKTLNVTNFNTNNATNMSKMFYSCGSLTSLNLSNFNLNNAMIGDIVYNVTYSNITFPSNFKPLYTRYDSTNNIIYVNNSKASSSYIINTGEKFRTGYSSSIYQTTINFENQCKPSFKFTNLFQYFTSLTFVNISRFNLSECTDISRLYYGYEGNSQFSIPSINWNIITNASELFANSKITSIDLSNIIAPNLVNITRMFASCDNLTSVNLSNFNASNLTTMTYMFYWCTKLTTINLSNFNAANVRNMNSVFYYCTVLTSLNLTNFVTTNAIDMSYMFSGCYVLTSLNLSSFNTSNVTNMSEMFDSCNALVSLNLSNFNTSNVTDMYGMFDSCNALVQLNLSSFNTINVTDMGAMFNNCRALMSLNLSNFNTSNVTNMYSMFNNCNVLGSLNLLSFNTTNVTNMRNMFNNCYALSSLDLSSFNTSNVTNMNGMFTNNSDLEKITVGENWDVSNVTDSANMFGSCISIVGQNGTTYDPTRIDKSMANYETGYLSVYGLPVTITVNPNNSGQITGAGIYSEGDEVTLIAIPGTNYDFINWTKNGVVLSTDSTYIFTMGSESLSLVANFGLKPYLTVDLTPSGYGTVTGSGYYSPNTVISLSATPGTRKVFTKWESNGITLSTDNPYQYTTTNSDRTITGVFDNAPTYSVNVHSVPSNATIYQDKKQDYSGETVTVRAYPMTNYSFVKWEDGSTNPNRTVILPNHDIDLIAYYAKNIEQNDNYEYYCYVKNQLNLTGKPVAFMVAREFNISEDLLASATAEITVLEMNTNVHPGDILVIYSPKGKTIYQGVITSFEENKIQCSQMQHFYSGNWLYTTSSKSSLEAEIAYILGNYKDGKMLNSTYTDPLIASRLGGISISSSTTTSGSLVTKENNTVMNFEDFIYSLYESYGIIFDFTINFSGSNTCTIKVPSYSALKISNNNNSIVNMSPVTNIEETNRLIIYSSNGTYKATYVTKTDGTNVDATTLSDTESRFKVTNTNIVFSDDTVSDLVASNLPSTMYNHKLTFTLRLDNNLYNFDDFKLGMPLSVYMDGDYFDTVLTGWEINKEPNKNIEEVNIICGKVRTSLTKKLLLGKV